MALALEHDRVRVGGCWRASFAVTGYPREVSRGWLGPLLHAARDADVAVHIEPLPPVIAVDRLRRQRARFESTRRLEQERGRLADPFIAAAAEDSEELMSRLARGQSRLFRAGLYLSVRAASRGELDERIERLRAICSSLLLHLVPASFRPIEGWLTTLPLGLDQLRLRRAFDTEALAASFPFAAADPPIDPDGVLYGLTPAGAPIILDRFRQDNYNTVLLARSGAGKSYLAKLEALRLLYRGVQVFVIDPEDEYRRLVHAVGGVHLPLAGPDAVTLNPLDLPVGGGLQTLDERVMFLTELLELLLGKLSGEELPVLERAIHGCYTRAGISADPATHRRPAPLLSDLRPLPGRRGGRRGAARRTAGTLRDRRPRPTLLPAGRGRPGRAARLLLPPRPPGAPQTTSAAADARQHLALARRAASQALRARRRSVAADARAGRRAVFVAAREERAEALVRADRDQPGRRRPLGQRTRTRGRLERRQPGATQAGAASDRADRAGVQPDRG